MTKKNNKEILEANHLRKVYKQDDSVPLKDLRALKLADKNSTIWYEIKKIIRWSK